MLEHVPGNPYDRLQITATAVYLTLPMKLQIRGIIRLLAHNLCKFPIIFDRGVIHPCTQLYQGPGR